MQNSHVPSAKTQVPYPYLRLYQSYPKLRTENYIHNLTLFYECNYQYMDYRSTPRITAILQLKTGHCDHTFDCSHYRYFKRYSSIFERQMACISSTQVRRWEFNTYRWFLSVNPQYSVAPSVGSELLTIYELQPKCHSTSHFLSSPYLSIKKLHD